MDGAAASSASAPVFKGTTGMDASTTRTLHESVLRRLTEAGVPADLIASGPSGIVDFVNQDGTRLAGAVSALFPDVDEVKSVAGTGDGQAGDQVLSLCEDAVGWVQWLLFSGDPKASISAIGLVNGGQRGVCGAVWGSDDIAYRCRTCENDPTCAVCVPCFHAGDHRNHDYCMIRTCGGCCDCGDATAWKKTGFCNNHRGPGFVPSLSPAFLTKAGPVLATVLHLWASKLNTPEADADGKLKTSILDTPEGMVASQTSVAIIDMLLDFCNTSESMLSFTAKYVGMRSLGVLDAILRTEAFLQEKEVERLHVLLYKLLGDTDFKCSFAQGFIRHYPKFMRDSIQDELAGSESDSNLTKADHAILSSFSVQIFTVPTLTPKLVLESGLLDMLLETLKELFLACVGDNGRIMVSKSRVMSKLFNRVCEDIRYVMSHLEVAQFVARKRPELAKAWLEPVAFVQGIYPQRRVCDMHVEEENDDWESFFSLEMQMAPIHPLFTLGAASGAVDEQMDDDTSNDVNILDDDSSSVRHAKLGRITKDTEGMDAGRGNGVDVDMDDATNASCAGGREFQTLEATCSWSNGEPKGTHACRVPAPLLWLLAEGISFLDRWLALDASRELAKGHGQPNSRTTNPIPRRSLLGGRARGLSRAGRTTALLLEPAEPAATRTLVAAPGQVAFMSPPLAITHALAPGQATNPPPPPTRGLDPAPHPGLGHAAVPTRTVGPADIVPGRSGLLREWLRRQRRQFTERAGSHDERVSRSSGAGTSSGDMDAINGLDPERTSEKAGSEWWMGADVSGVAPVKVQFGADDWPTVKFDVSRQDVSFHIPLHRIVAILLQKTLESHSSNSKASSGSVPPTSSVPLQQFLPEKYRMPGFASFMMEHPLRLQVLSAQVQAGMWRRNGRPINKFCEFYRTVPWCEDTLELDLFILQCCAVIAPPEMFVDRVQTRFGLAEYFTLRMKPPSEYEPTLAQEFLVLLIRICVERGFCGLSPEDALRRELVHRLAVSDSTHSSLIRALPHRLRDSKYLADCLNSVAVYRNPSGLQQGKFSLRKDCWRELDLYHPRWSPRELQGAEDRYFRACKTSPIFTQLPFWKEPFSPLKMLGRFVTSTKVHDILHSVFFHAAFSASLSNSRAPEGLLFVALHLLALALNVCSYLAPSKQDLDEDFGQTSFAQEMAGCGMPHSKLGAANIYDSYEGVEELPILAQAIQRVMVYPSGALQPEQHSLLSLMVLLMRKHGSDRTQAGSLAESSQQNAGDVIKVLLRKFADLHRGCMYEIEFLAPEILHRQNISAPPAGEKPGIDGFKKAASTEEERRRATAKERQQAIMAKMKADQDRFLASLQGGPSEKQGEQSDNSHQQQVLEMGERTSEESMTPTCALCRDSGFASPLCFLTLVQKSRILAFVQNPPPSWKDPAPPILDLIGRKNGRSGGILGRNDIRMYPTEEFTEFLTPMPEDPGGPALWETVRHGLHPGVRNVVMVANALGIPTVRGIPQFEVGGIEGESSGDGNDVDSSQDEGPLYGPTWWEGPVSTNSDEGSNREAGQLTVLDEYVTAVSRGRRQLRELHQPRALEARALEVEIGQEGGVSGRARRSPGRNIMDATVNTGFGITDMAGVHLSACGHAVHQECLDRYLSTLLERFYGRALFEGVHIVDPDMGEYLCPVCRRLSNSAIPISTLGPGAKAQNHGLGSVDKSMDSNSLGESDVIPELQSCHPGALRLEQSFSMLSSAERIVCDARYRKSASSPVPDFIKGTLDTLALRVHGLLNPDREHVGGVNGRVPQTLHLWDLLRYSLMSAELATRAHHGPSFPRRSLHGITLLEEAVDAGKGSVLPLLLQAAQLVQGQSRQVVLLRSRGMQLVADTINAGLSRDIFSENSGQGNFSSLLQYLERDQDSPDVQFWKRMADPILLHDPFSSLLWLLFCLPLQLPSGHGPFTSLVHLFYLVCLTQALAHTGSALAPELEVVPSASTFIAAVQASLHGKVLSSFERNYHFSLFDEPAASLLRRMMLPFLRQCYMLQKLLSGSHEVLPVPSTHLWELSQRSMASGVQHSSKSCEAGGGGDGEISPVELEELDALESFFGIPPLMVWLNDDNAQRVALTWCQHVSGEAGILTQGNVPRPVRATPFKLMRLPHLFQDLLRRYNKECCLRCNTVPDSPALCLFCGTLCCDVSPHSSCSCSSSRQSECYRHAMACGAGLGVFLLLRITNVLLQRCERRALWPSPYLDCYGEEDHEGRLKPLFLSEERYAALTSMVASHGLDYSSLVLALTSRENP